MQANFLAFITITTALPDTPPMTVTERWSTPTISYAVAMDSAMANKISLLDSFQEPGSEQNVLMCGPTRPLDSIHPMFRMMETANGAGLYNIVDDMVMDYWEYEQDSLYWTPLCYEIGARVHQVVR